ncbi:MAG TPA: hypothetical protein VHD62_17730 [Opitutaceae bacterium]|nr:hypothetical protein [Opitutaceae bacterium]
MTKIPPLLPAEVLARVIRLARLDGLSLLGIAGFFALLSAAGGDFVGAIAGLLVAGAGALELHGKTLLEHADARGTSWLVNSQLVALVSILAYCAVRIAHVQLPPLPDEVRSVIEFDAAQVGMTAEHFMLTAYRGGFELVALVSVFYQGGMALYYLRRRAAVRRAFAEDAAE